MSVSASPARVQRFSRRVLDLGDSQRFHHLPDALTAEPIYADHSWDETFTFVAREADIPRRYLLGILGFRLAQYLHRGSVNREVLYRNGFVHEPIRPQHPIDDYHIITLCERTGQILCYATMQATLDPQPLDLADGERYRFVAERDHDVDLLAALATPARDTHHVYELKRLVRVHHVPEGHDGALLPWRVLLGLARCVQALERERGELLIVGDGKGRGTLHALELLGFDMTRIHPPHPTMPAPNDLFAPLFDQRVKVLPFVGWSGTMLAPTLDTLQEALDRPGTTALPRLLARLRTTTPGRDS